MSLQFNLKSENIMKKTHVFTLLCMAGLLGKAQYTGITDYDHSGNNVILSSGGITSVHSPSWGFLMGSYVPFVPAGNYNLFIDKTDAFAQIPAAPPEFEMMYQVFAGAPCTTPANQLLNCYGVSLMETNQVGFTNKYMLAAAFDKGCVIGALDISGNVLSSPNLFFPFPGSAVQPSKPLITASLSNPNQNLYYVAGSYLDASAATRFMYVMLIDAVTNSAIWSNLYNIGAGTSLEPKAIIESPFFPPPVLVIAGIADPNDATLGREGFLLHLDGTAVPSGGSVVAPGLQFIGTSTASNEEFHSLSPIPGTGYYVIGGFTDDNPGNGNPWMLTFDPSAPTIGWSSQILPSSAPDGPVVGVIHRVGIQSGTQFFGAVHSSAGSLVVKLDSNGQPFGTAPNEFLYNPAAPSVSEPAAITDINVPGDINEGIHIYGTDGTSQGRSYICQAFYNGTSGTCPDMNPTIQFTTNITRVPGPNTMNLPPNISVINGLSNCPNHFIMAMSNPANPNALCPFTGNPTGPYTGSNARPAVTTGIPQQSLNTGQISIQPNPVQEMLTLRYTLSSQQPVKIEIFNALGQRVKAFDQPSQPGENQMNIDFSTLGVESGIYFIHTSIGQNTDKQKVIYQK
jgi:hypothetical protein